MRLGLHSGFGIRKHLVTIQNPKTTQRTERERELQTPKVTALVPVRLLPSLSLLVSFSLVYFFFSAKSFESLICFCGLSFDFLVELPFVLRLMAFWVLEFGAEISPSFLLLGNQRVESQLKSLDELLLNKEVELQH